MEVLVWVVVVALFPPLPFPLFSFFFNTLLSRFSDPRRRLAVQREVEDRESKSKKLEKDFMMYLYMVALKVGMFSLVKICYEKKKNEAVRR